MKKYSRYICLLIGIFLILTGLVVISQSSTWSGNSFPFGMDGLELANRQTVATYMIMWALAYDFIALVIAMIGILLIHRFFVLSDRVCQLK